MIPFIYQKSFSSKKIVYIYVCFGALPIYMNFINVKWVVFFKSISWLQRKEIFY